MEKCIPSISNIEYKYDAMRRSSKNQGVEKDLINL